MTCNKTILGNDVKIIFWEPKLFVSVLGCSIIIGRAGASPPSRLGCSIIIIIRKYGSTFYIGIAMVVLPYFGPWEN